MTAQRADASGAGVNDFWHYAVGSEKRGPVPRTTIAKLLASGEVSAETYVWQPGMDNWVHLGDAPTLKSLVAALDGDGQPEEFVEEDTTFTPAAQVKAVHNEFDVRLEDVEEEEGLSSDTIVEPIANVAAAVAAVKASSAPVAELAATQLVSSYVAPSKAQADKDKADLFESTMVSAIAPAAKTGPSSDLFGRGDDLFGGGPESQDEGPEGVVGVHGRRQSSVLFKLDDLGRESNQKSSENQQFVTDSSGLIDIRAIATNERKPASGEDPFGNSAPNLVLPPRTSMSPLQIPIVERRRGVGPWILAAVAVLVAGGVALAVILSGKDAPEPQAVAQGTTNPAPNEPAKAEPAKADPAKADPAKPADNVAKVEGEVKPAEVAAVDPTKPTDGAAGANAANPANPADPNAANTAGADGVKPADGGTVANVAANPTEVKPEDKPKTTDKPKVADKPKTEDKPKVEDKPKTEDKPKVEVVAAPSNPTNPNNTSKVNDLLNKLNQGEKTTTTTEGGAGDDSLPNKLSAASVRNAIKGRFASCGGMISNPAGSVTVQTQFVISSSGVVQSANVTDGGGTSADVQRCVVGVIKSTTFGKFKEPSMQVNLPVRLL